VEALTDRAVHDQHAEAVEESVIVFLEGGGALMALLEEPEFSTHLVRLLIHEMLEVERRLQVLLAGGAIQRVARLLWILLDSHDAVGSRSLKLTNETLAAMVGTSPQTVSSCLGRLQRRGIIARERGWIRIIEPDGMGSFT